MYHFVWIPKYRHKVFEEPYRTVLKDIIRKVGYDYDIIARSDGANIAVGGKRREDLGPGNYITPTLFTDANNSMRIAQEEILARC